MSAPTAFARFSTDDYAKHERVAAWSEILGRHCGVRIDIDSRFVENFQASAKLARRPDFGLIEGSTSPNRREFPRLDRQ
jgi:hypothetical protein